ncbi:MAG TPA: uracil-DNA glycosylase [Candidatus Sulfotelmatobacter sp.]|jgi:uracil-DNA glycosylase family 4|nr:uracil-DNA glycosylase [Candidatus Sulfotelmatobacter sp.]
MDPAPTPKQREKLEAWLRYYDDLGLGVFYNDRRRAGERAAQSEPAAAIPIEAPPVSKPIPMSAPHAKPAPPSVLPVVSETSLFEAIDRVENDTIERIREDLGECTRCRLHKRRNKIVFGAGNPRAELVFVGEGPGHDEDVQGLPFVGRAGKLLTQMIEAMGLRRDDVYICNVVKCRPPENRKPEDDEVATCSPYLYRQLEVIAPKAIVCLGATAAQALLKTKDSISRYRGQWFDFRGTKLLVTYHPAYLLRNPNAKGDVWKDLQKVMTHLGLKAKKASQ